MSRVGRIDVDVVAAGVLVFREHLLKRLAAVGRAIDAALLVGTVRVAERGDEEAVGIARVDGDVGDLLRVAQAQMRPRLAGVGRLVDAVAGREIRPVQAFAAADVDDVGVGRRDGDRADGSGRLVVEDRLPHATGVGRLPDAAVDRRHIERVRVAAMPGRRARPARAMRTDVPPAQIGEEARARPAPLLGRQRTSSALRRPAARTARQRIPAAHRSSPLAPRRHLFLHRLGVADDDERHLVGRRGTDWRFAARRPASRPSRASRRSPGTGRRGRAGRRTRAGRGRRRATRSARRTRRPGCS